MKTCMTMLMLAASLMFGLAACGGDEPEQPRREKREPDRVLRKDPPPEYAMKEIPEDVDLNDQELIDKGREIFQAEEGPRCFDCHGQSGKGDGLVQTPGIPAADMTADSFQDEVTDQYIFWRVKTGPVGYSGRGQSPMTGFMTGDDNDIWALVAYVRSLRG